MLNRVVYISVCSLSMIIINACLIIETNTVHYLWGGKYDPLVLTICYYTFPIITLAAARLLIQKNIIGYLATFVALFLYSGLAIPEGIEGFYEHHSYDWYYYPFLCGLWVPIILYSILCIKDIEHYLRARKFI